MSAAASRSASACWRSARRPICGPSAALGLHPYFTCCGRPASLTHPFHNPSKMITSMSLASGHATAGGSRQQPLFCGGLRWVSGPPRLVKILLVSQRAGEGAWVYSRPGCAQ